MKTRVGTPVHAPGVVAPATSTLGALTRAALVLTALMLALTANVVGAHHSFAMFDRQRTLTMSGTVREFQWTNPHAWIQVVVHDAEGREQEWSIESGSRNMMARQGWTRRTLLPGDKIGLVIRPALDGSLAGSLVSVTLIDGTVLGPGGAPPPRTGNAPPPTGNAPAPE